MLPLVVHSRFRKFRNAKYLFIPSVAVSRLLMLERVVATVLIPFGKSFLSGFETEEPQLLNFYEKSSFIGVKLISHDVVPFLR